MIEGKFNVILDQAWGSSGKGKTSAWLADRFSVTAVSSSNFPNAGHCQVAETMVVSDRGLERLGDVVKKRSAVSMTNMDGKAENVSAFVPDGVRTTNLIRLKNGVSLECTDVHMYFVWDSVSGRREWVRSMDLDPKTHQFLFPKFVHFPENRLLDGSYSHPPKGNKTELLEPKDEVAFAEYLGLLIGDGYYAKGTRVDVAFHSSQLDVLERVQSFYSSIGLTNCPVSRVGEKECFVISTGQVSGLLDLFRSVGLKPAVRDSKETPAAVLLSNKAVLAGYLRGLFDSDGSAKSDRVTFSNCSESVVRDAQQILYVLGVHSSVSFYDDKPGRTGSNRLRQWILSVSGKRNMVEFEDRIGFMSAVKRGRLGETIKGTRDQGQAIRLPRFLRKACSHLGIGSGKKGNTRTSFVMERADSLASIPEASELLEVCRSYHVVKIKDVVRENREVEVFDLTMMRTHSYLANGCISHNTARFEDGTKFVAKAIPTAAILRKVKGLGIDCFVSPGSGFDPVQLIKEWEECGHPNLRIHERASIVTAEHKSREASGEDSTKHVASTMQGSAAAMVDKILRKSGVALAANMWAPVYGLDVDGLEGRLKELVDNVKVHDALEFRTMTRNMISSGQTWLHEGSQGYALSIDHGSHYPHCTSRNCTLQQAMDHMAIPPSMVGDVYLNLRSYPIRVGNVVEDGVQKGYSGDFYPDCEELTWEEVAKRSGMPEEEARELAERERTTVTKRIRRVATFSMGGLRDAAAVNGATKLVVNFAQYLNWKDAGLRGGRSAFLKLSGETRKFIDDVQTAAGIPVVLVGTGADHEDMISLL
jgi:adenylosuccinate synthase